jgi:hypothetical protein
VKNNTSAEDCLAALVGNAPSMKELVKLSKGEDKNDKSFMALIKIHTITYMADLDENSKSMLQPALDIDKDFYKQRWVQKKIKEGMKATGKKGRLFRERFWSAVTYKLQPTYQKFGYAGEGTKNNKSELKRFVVLRRDKWKKNGFTYEDIFNECLSYKVLSENCYSEEPDSFRRYLNTYGISWRSTGRPKGSKNRI